MKVKVIRGSNKIGGCIVQVSNKKGEKIIIDYGEELDVSSKEETDFPIEGLTDGKKEIEAVFITHSHGDHIGLIQNIKKNIPVFIEETSYKIFKISSEFCSKKPFNGQVKLFKFNEPIFIGDFKITPYQTDHSAYNSAMFLIESDNERILHLGDYRSNGYNGPLFYENLKKIKNVDLLITEGTSITRSKTENMTEEELTQKAISIFQNYKQVFILQASTNIDIIKSFYKAACETNKNFILDVSTANVLKVINDKEHNYLEKDNVSVWVPTKYQNEDSPFYKYKDKDFYNNYVKPYNEKITRNNKNTHNSYVMLVKTSMFNDIKNCLKRYRDNAVLIYSMWGGYKDENRENTEKTIEFIEKLKSLNIKEEDLHTSGHADTKTMRTVNEIVKPKKTIGIHTENNELLSEIFDNYQVISDNIEIEVKDNA